MTKNPYGDDVFYADLDEDSGEFCVFGNQSGFAYASFFSMEQAEAKARVMNGLHESTED